MAFLQTPLRALDIVDPLDRTGGLPRGALIEVSLAGACVSTPGPASVQLPFELALTHLLGFRAMRGRLWHQRKTASATAYGAWSGGAVSATSRIAQLSRHRRTVLGASPARRQCRVHATSIAGGTQRDPEGTSREPRRRCYGHRRGISLPKAPYQNAARMSRGAEGTTEASGRRDQGRAGRPKEAGGRCPGRCPRAKRTAK